jgi:broad specificity phosphatase PhoE
LYVLELKYSQRHWAKQSGDGTTTWLDAELTPKGEQQATSIASIWGVEDGVPPPQTIYTSPLRRCLRTTQFAFAPCISDGTNPVVKEKLRERLGVHTCDRSWIAAAYPSFTIEPGSSEEDELWDPDRRETLDEHIARSTELLQDIFSNDESMTVALTAHSGAMMALFAATEWKKVFVTAGVVYPLLVCATNEPGTVNEDFM